jgi:hypothetical protein
MVPILLFVFPATVKSIYCDANKPYVKSIWKRIIFTLECGEDRMQNFLKLLSDFFWMCLTVWYFSTLVSSPCIIFYAVLDLWLLVLK